METFRSGGVMMWPLLLVAVGVVVLAVRTGLAIQSSAPSDPRIRGSLTSLLFWGGMAMLLGLLGTTVGLVTMARAVQMAGAASPALIWGGVGVSLVTLVFGILIFLMAGFVWVALDQWHRRRLRNEPAGSTAPG